MWVLFFDVYVCYLVLRDVNVALGYVHKSFFLGTFSALKKKSVLNIF